MTIEATLLLHYVPPELGLEGLSEYRLVDAVRK
jgi:hypothetical protein